MTKGSPVAGYVATADNAPGSTMRSMRMVSSGAPAFEADTCAAAGRVNQPATAAVTIIATRTLDGTAPAIPLGCPITRRQERGSATAWFPPNEVVTCSISQARFVFSSRL